MQPLPILSLLLCSRSHRSLVVLALAALFLLSGCAEAGQMIDQPRYDPLEASALFPDGRSARPAVPGTVPYSGDKSANDPAKTGLDENGEPLAGFPVTVNAELLAEGQERFEIYCTPCHGPAGEGNGKVVTYGFPKPPSLLENARTLSNGEIFGIITNGQGNMFPYAYRVKAEERWAVIAYLRALQLKDGKLNLQELTPAEIEQIGQQP